MASAWLLNTALTYIQFTIYLYKQHHTHSNCKGHILSSHVIPLTLPLITPIRHRKENENIFLFPLTPPASPFLTVPWVRTPAGSSLGFTEQLTCHMAPLSFSSCPYHTGLCFGCPPLLSSSSTLFLHPERALHSFSVGNPGLLKFEGFRETRLISFQPLQSHVRKIWLWLNNKSS